MVNLQNKNENKASEKILFVRMRECLNKEVQTFIFILACYILEAMFMLMLLLYL
jgi:hypothetical protein